MKERNYFLKRKHVKTRAGEEVTRITITCSCKWNIKHQPVVLWQFWPDLTMRRTRTICVSEEAPRPTWLTASPTCPSPAAPRACSPRSPTPTSPARCLVCWAPPRTRSASPARPVRPTRRQHQTPTKCIWRSRHISQTVARSVDVCWSPALIIKTQPKTPEPRAGAILGSPSPCSSPTQQQGKLEKRDSTKTGECFGAVLHS